MNTDEKILRTLKHLGSATRYQLMLFLSSDWKEEEVKTSNFKIEEEDSKSVSGFFIKENDGIRKKFRYVSKVKDSVNKTLSKLKKSGLIESKRINGNATETYYLSNSMLHRYKISNHNHPHDFIDSTDFKAFDFLLNCKKEIECELEREINVNDFGRIIFPNFNPNTVPKIEKADLVVIIPKADSEYNGSVYVFCHMVGDIDLEIKRFIGINKEINELGFELKKFEGKFDDNDDKLAFQRKLEEYNII